MSNGIIMVAFGEQYDAFAAHCVAYSRKYTDLPVAVVSNLGNNRSIKWSGLKNIEFIDLILPQDQNRQIKTSLIEYTPFDKTLYLDCDAVIQNKGIEKIFDLISPDSLLLNIYGRFTSRLPGSGYKKAVENAKVTMPLNIYYGALMGFMKSEKTSGFFSLWNTYWKQNGSGREMPALACAVKNSGIPVVEIGNKHGYFSWLINRKAIIQHEYAKHVRRLVGCPNFKAYKPFDHRVKAAA